MKKKLQVFVSSTFEDLKLERQLVMEAILELGHIPAGMEYFISDDLEQFKIIKRWIEKSDAYILISGGRYGSINEHDSLQRSYTHLEYDYAHTLKKPIGIIRLSDQYLKLKKGEGTYTDDDLNNPNLISFRKNLKLSNNVHSKHEIKSAAKTLVDNFSHELLKKPCGWIRLESVSDLLYLHQNNVALANRKLLKGTYHIHYYSFGHNRFVHSTISFNTKTNNLNVVFKNDIICEKPKYTYKGQFDIYDDYLYIEAKSDTDNEKICLIVRLFPGKLRMSSGILIGQGTAKQAAATSFLISETKIDEIDLLEKFKSIQSTILINDELIIELSK